jgi:alkylated DNA repair protein (DNA oxidative demethylase)
MLGEMLRAGAELRAQLSLGLPEPVSARPAALALAPGAVVLAGFALADAQYLLDDLARVTAAAPFRHLVTPGGHRMSVGMTNCGALGWVSDASGYRYDGRDPETGRPWPELPASFRALAASAAARAGFADYEPDACLVNHYEPGARLTLHQDKNEHDTAAPIVSVSLGLPCVFLFGGDTRDERPTRVPLFHGDVVVWGGPARMRYHGVLAIKEGSHAVTGACRINLTFRKAR